MLKHLLSHPLTRRMDLEDPGIIPARRKLVQKKGFLKKIYEEWYRRIVRALGTDPRAVLELGSGPGFFKKILPACITSEITWLQGIDLVADGCRLPFADRSLDAIVMTDVFHHLSKPEAFLRESARCIAPGGKVAMVEPWVTGWSSFVFRRLHHEPFLPDAPTWDPPAGGPLTGANGALPWIVFERDRDRFQRQCPEWKIETLYPFMPLSYLLSGGVSLRSLMPGWSYGMWRTVESMMRPLESRTAMFALIVLVRGEIR